MSSPARLKEAAAASATAQVAVAYLATMATLELMKLWGDAAGGGAEASATFVRRALKVITLRRKQISQITAAELRLQRTLKTGQPLRLPSFDGTVFRHRTTLDEVRNDFVTAVKDYAPEALKPNPKIPAIPRKTSPRVQKGDPDVAFTPYEKPPSRSDDYDTITEELLKGLEEEILREEEELERATQEALRHFASKEAAAKRERKAAKKARKEGERRQSQEDELADLLSGQLNAGKVAWSATRAHAARMSEKVAAKDPRVIGYIRVHYSFDGSKPCAFCAALLSRGAVYKSAARAGGQIGSVTQFHPNCRCKGEAIYKGEDPMGGNNPKYAANRFYRDLWQKQIKQRGLQRDTARKTWRNLIDAYNRGHWRPGDAV